MREETEVSFSPDKLQRLMVRMDEDSVLLAEAIRKLHIAPSERYRLEVIKKSIDARKRDHIKIRYRVCVTDDPIRSVQASHTPYLHPKKIQPVVVGFGPAGMMAALYLARSGANPIVIERGSPVEKREQRVAEYFSTGIVDPVTNIQFGEGGAGTFSDGKLNSGVSDERREYVLDAFVAAGAPRDILISNRPHVGTDVLRTMVVSIRKEIIQLGGSFLFERRVVGFDRNGDKLSAVLHVNSNDPDGSVERLPADRVILAIGHSARDTFRSLISASIHLEAKPMSVGLRIEHHQHWLDRIRYGKFADSPVLPRSEYKLWAHTKNERTLYTFCMCPGGFVVASASQAGEIVTNGMSLRARDGQNANSAILVGVNTEDYLVEGPLGGILFQEDLERKAFVLGGSNGIAPGQTVSDFLANRSTSTRGSVLPSYQPGVKDANLRQILPGFVTDTICEGLQMMDRKLNGFAGDAYLTGVETRSSSPVRIVRDNLGQSISLHGLFPCGEGAGYAGGIMSSAIDGIRCAQWVQESLT